MWARRAGEGERENPAAASSKKFPSCSLMLNYSFEPIHAKQEYNEEWLNSFITLPLQEYL